MPNYVDGKIYQVISPNHPLPYIGSTTQRLCNRMAVHRYSQDCNSRILIEAGGAYIELIEDYPCENKEQLNRREGEIIRERECVNKNIAGRTVGEYREVNKEVIKARQSKYYKMNREAIGAQQKAYYEANREAIGAHNKAYQETIPEKVKAWKSKYREANREAINARARDRWALMSSVTESPLTLETSPLS